MAAPDWPELRGGGGERVVRLATRIVPKRHPTVSKDASKRSRAASASTPPPPRASSHTLTSTVRLPPPPLRRRRRRRRSRSLVGIGRPRRDPRRYHPRRRRPRRAAATTDRRVHPPGPSRPQRLDGDAHGGSSRLSGRLASRQRRRQLCRLGRVAAIRGRSPVERAPHARDVNVRHRVLALERDRYPRGRERRDRAARHRRRRPVHRREIVATIEVRPVRAVVLRVGCGREAEELGGFTRGDVARDVGFVHVSHDEPHDVVAAAEPAQLLRRIEVAVLASRPAGAKVQAVHGDDGVAAGYREGWDRRAGLVLDARAHVLRGGDVEAGEDEDEDQHRPRTQTPHTLMAHPHRPFPPS